jgi:hypothetical protein
MTKQNGSQSLSIYNFDLDKDYKKYPKFRHNLWITPDYNPEITYLTVSHSTFEVPTNDALKFLQIRSHCTGHNTVEMIASKSGMSAEEVSALIDPLIEAEVLHLPFSPIESLLSEEILKSLYAACQIWSEQLAECSIVYDIIQGKVQRSVVLGWLLEMYHYIKAFPFALDLAAESTSGLLKEVFTKYASEERGHEEFVLQTLVNAGMSRQEVEQSIPLVSTRTIDFIMRDLFLTEPFSVLLVARIIEAHDFNEKQFIELDKVLVDKYQFSPRLLDPFVEHIKIDAQLEHSDLFDKYAALAESNFSSNLHVMVNKIHDLKHAFDLQKLEIKEYYSNTGNYFPRQFVDFFAI